MLAPETEPGPRAGTAGEIPAAGLLQEFQRVRNVTVELIAGLSDEDCCVQSMPDASPAKWHIAHTTWFFETFILEPYERGFLAHDPAFRVLFNSYYNSIGDRHPRHERGLITRPALEQVLDYRVDVDRRMRQILEGPCLNPDLRNLVLLGIQHEQQHQELILTDLKHLFHRNPLHPAYRKQAVSTLPNPHPLAWVPGADGFQQLGYAGREFCFDNELPRHKTWLQPYRIGNRLVTNGEFLQFLEQGGYADPSLWLSDGWAWLQTYDIDKPLYWIKGASGWEEFSLAGCIPLDPRRPVTHVCYYEADAFARWAEARLPLEAEWEAMAASLTVRGNFADHGSLHPEPTGAPGLSQMYGDVWEWTMSAYAPYPGYRPALGAVGEYNGKFMVNQYVLRGGSCVTPAGHVRSSYRNFFPASAQWQFTGIRLARDGT